MNPIVVEHFSDVLCIWAYVSQIRIDELGKRFGDAVKIKCHFFEVFGDVRGKLDSQWAERGGVAGYAEHVRSVAERFEHVELHPHAWTETTPRSSMPAHIFLAAVELLDAERGASEQCARAARALRSAFFRDQVDVSRRQELMDIGRVLDLDVDRIGELIDSGAAHARLGADRALAQQYDVRASPTLVFNEGRQRLVGNVGYRVIEANVRELLDSPTGQHSWC